MIAPSIARDISTKRDAALLDALGCPTRLCILQVLRTQSGTMRVDGLVQRLAEEQIEIEQSSVSYHLRVLSHVGLITYRQAGVAHYYTICPQALQRAIDIITALYPSRRESEVSA